MSVNILVPVFCHYFFIFHSFEAKKVSSVSLTYPEISIIYIGTKIKPMFC